MIKQSEPKPETAHFSISFEKLSDDNLTPTLQLDVEKSFPEYVKNSDADYIAVDFYSAAAISCYERDGNLYTGSTPFLNSDFYNRDKDEFTRLKPPYE